MKTNYFFKLFALAIICCLNTALSAQTQVTDSLSFANALTDLQSPTGSTGGTGGVIQLNASLTLRPWKTTYILASTATAPIEINTQGFSITVSGTNTTADSTILKIGDNLNIHGTANVFNNLNKGIIRITGSQISSTTTTAGVSTIYSNSGWCFISGGTITMNATGVANAFAVNAINNYPVVIRGGTIIANGDNTRALSLTDGVTTSPIYNATFTVNGNGAYAIQSLGNNALTIGDNITINTSSTNSTDAALVGGGGTSRIVIPATATNVNITSAIKYKLDNAGSAVIDLRGLTLTASPASGSSLTYPGNNVTLTASGNGSSSTCGIYYGYVTAPTTLSPNIASGASVAASSANTVLKASFGKNGFIDTNVFTFNYTVSNLPANLPVDVTTFADLLTAYTNSQTGTPRTTTINILASLITTGAYTITPASDYPVIITANTFNIKTGSSGTWGGNLSASNNSLSATGIFQIAGAFTTNFTGGTYTGNNNQGLIFANTGQSVDNTLTKLYLSNSTFTVNGTTNGACIIKYLTANGNNINATNCTFNVTGKGLAYSLVGPSNLLFSNSTINYTSNDATSIAVSFAPTSVATNNVTVDGLTVNMTLGKVFSLAGSKALNTIIKDLTISSATPTLYSAGTTAGFVLKFYDFRAFTPTSSLATGTYNTTQSATLTLPMTSVLPVDATNATIVYTLDGTDPIATSTAYSTALSISSTTTLKVAALKDGFVGKPAVYTYTFGTTAAASLVNENNLQVYPTTVENTLNISNTAQRVQIYDLTGKSVISRTNVIQMDLSSLNSGVYFVKVSLKDATSKTFKIIKE